MKTILLADDDAAIRQTLGQVLTLEQYQVVLASTGREAAVKFTSQMPDLVLLDISMPDHDGWDTFSLMNGMQPLVPVIIITARPHQHKRAASLGAAALLEKPLDIPVLLNTIHSVLTKTATGRTMGLAVT